MERVHHDEILHVGKGGGEGLRVGVGEEKLGVEGWGKEERRGGRDGGLEEGVKGRIGRGEEGWTRWGKGE